MSWIFAASIHLPHGASPHKGNNICIMGHFYCFNHHLLHSYW